MNFTVIKQLVTYYQISEKTEKQNSEEVVNFSVTFDKDKIHELFFEKEVSYSDITDKELFVLPVLIKENEVFIKYVPKKTPKKNKRKNIIDNPFSVLNQLNIK